MATGYSSINSTVLDNGPYGSFYNMVTNVEQGNVQEKSLVGYRDGVPTAWRDFISWSVKNPILLKDIIDMWMALVKHPINNLFDDEETDAEFFRQEELILDNFQLRFQFEQ